jgi:tetratricopeptide (TPR) repeat protein
MPVSPLELARYKRLAVRSSDVWQGGLVRFPAWIHENEDQPPYRARGAFWFSTRTGLIWPAMEETRGTAGVELALRGLIEFARKYERELLGRASRIEVTDAAFAAELRAALDDRDTTIAVVPDLPNVRNALRDFERFQAKDEDLPDPLLDSPGVTRDGLRRFADAAARFYDANIWDLVDPDDDLVAIEQPIVDPALRFLIVTGSTRDLRGVTFYESLAQYERVLTGPPRPGKSRQRMWIVSFDPIDWLPFGDVDAWTDHGLPAAAPDAYPRPGLIEPDGRLTRPDGERLAFLEAVLRALAASSEEDFDRGRWTRTVETAGGPVEVRLSLPRLLAAIEAGAREAGPRGRARDRRTTTPEQMLQKLRRALEQRGPASVEEARTVVESLMRAADDAPVSDEGGGQTPLEQAQQLAFDAMEAEGRYQTHLARRALEISRDCADAWTILGNRARTSAGAAAHYREAVAAGERALGADFFAEHAGHFWGLVEARPYMRARRALAEALEGEGLADDALAHYRELIRLNPNDNQGVRYLLLRLLLEEQQDEEARALLDQFVVDESATWLYAQALVAFRLEGKDADARLDRAIADNPHVPPFLTGEKELPALPAYYRPGSKEEAAIAADTLQDAWVDTNAAIFWLNTRRRLLKKSGGTRRSSKSG